MDELIDYIKFQADFIDDLIERMADADMLDDMDRVIFNKWSHEYQKIIAKYEATALTPAQRHSEEP